MNTLSQHKQEIINNLTTNCILNENLVCELNDPNLFYEIGLCFQKVEKYDEMEKYFRLASNDEHIESMLGLAYYYRFTKLNYDLCEKYYVMAINKNSSRAANNYACHCYNIGKYNSCEKYFKIAIDLMDLLNLTEGNISIISNYATFLKKFSRIDDAITYFKMAAERNHGKSMVELGNIYKYNKNDEDLSNEYYAMAINNNINNLEANVIGEISLSVAEYFMKKNNVFEAEKYYLMLFNSKNIKTNDVAKLININFQKNDMEKVNFYFNATPFVDHYYLDYETSLMINYLKCTNNKATIAQLSKFYEVIYANLSVEIKKKHYMKIITINSHFNYLVTKDIEKEIIFSNKFKDTIVN